ncbi:hypothetical protein, partial [Bacteroides sp. 1_1_30]|uniref:hypothetical protein n=1 Tax=Bacteroides sp. 1_1_30 TaxID=457387 RepID=UPI003510AB63
LRRIQSMPIMPTGNFVKISYKYSFKLRAELPKMSRFGKSYGRNSAVKELPAWKEVLERRNNITHWPG